MRDSKTLDAMCINTIRTLSMDAVQAANSGHPGTPMALAPVAYCLWQQFLRFDPQDSIWPNRDRFVLSAGHASMLLYSLLHLMGVKAVNKDYETLGEPSVSLEAIKRFRQMDSRYPGHLEHRWTSGVETTTGPLGEEEIKGAKRHYGWPEDARFFIPDGVYDHFRNGIGKRGKELRDAWFARVREYKAKYPQLAERLYRMQHRQLPDGWDKNIPACSWAWPKSSWSGIRIPSSDCSKKDGAAPLMRRAGEETQRAISADLQEQEKKRPAKKAA